MSELSIDQLKSRTKVGVVTVVLAVVCISAFGVLSELACATAASGGVRLSESVTLRQSALTLVLCLVIAILTRVLCSHADNLKQVRSVVEGQQAELAIKAAQIDAARDTILQVDEQGRIVHFNQALCRLTGYTAAELEGQRLQDIEPPECAAQVIKVIRKIKECGEATFESGYLAKNGTVVPIEVHAWLMECEGRPLVLSIGRDITQRKRSEELERSRLKALERIASDASLEELLTCVVRFVEQSCPGSLCSILLIDESGTRLRHGAAPSLPEQFNDAAEWLPIARGTGSGGVLAVPRQRVVVEDLELHPQWQEFQPAREAGLRSCWSEPVFASNGSLLGTVALYHREPLAPTGDDILLIESAAHLAGIAIGRVRADEGRRVLEQQLRQSQKIEAVGQLAAGVAHDFNNLLTPVIVYADMLRRGFPDGSPQAHMTDSIGIAAQKASDLTHRLLSFGRKQTVNMHLLDLNEVIVSFEPIMRATARDNVAIDLRLSPGPVKVHADRGQLEQLLLNLLLNAQDAIEGAGAICLETGHLILDDDFARQHPVAKPGHYILLAFSDDGCGMSEQTLRRMYEPFFSTKEVGRGTGLGLATVYGIVRHHDGCIDAKSRIGEGTRFEIYLPASASAEEPILGPIRRQASEPAAGAGRTILLVEDNAMIREMAGELLTSFGYRVLAAESPAVALKMAAGESGCIDLLATDVVMPGMTGPELYQRILEGRPNLPVLYISGYTSNVVAEDEASRQEAIFLAKPFTMEQFMARIAAMLHGATSEEEELTPLSHEAMALLLANREP